MTDADIDVDAIRAEIIEMLLGSSQRDRYPPGVTAVEVASELGIGVDAARKRLKAAVRRGGLVEYRNVLINGRLQSLYCKAEQGNQC